LPYERDANSSSLPSFIHFLSLLRKKEHSSPLTSFIHSFSNTTYSALPQPLTSFPYNEATSPSHFLFYTPLSLLRLPVNRSLTLTSNELSRQREPFNAFARDFTREFSRELPRELPREANS